MKFRYSLLGLLVLLCCCKKNHSGSSVPGSGVFTYALQLDSVITVYPNSTYNYSFNVNVQSGDINSNPLYFSLSGLPAGVSVAPASIRVTQLFGGIFTFTIGNIPAGNDTMQLYITSNDFGTQKHNLILSVLSPPVYGAALAGTYDSCYDFCAPQFYYYKSVVTTVPDSSSVIRISNVRNLGAGFVVTAYLSTYIALPLQTVGGYTIWGTGIFTLDNRSAYNGLYMMMISDTLVSGIDTQYCVMHIQH